MNIKDSYIHNGTAVLKDVKVENSVLKKILAGKDANDAYLGWETVCDLTGIKPKTAETADKVGHKLIFSGGVTGTWDGSADKTVTIPTKSSWNYDDIYLKLSGGTITGPIKFSNSANSNLSNNYLSAGGGYSSNSGRLGLKLVSIDQNDIQAGIGVDLTGFTYETTISTGRRNDTTPSYITFATHNSESSSYKRLGYFKASGDTDPSVLFHVGGTVEASKFIGSLQGNASTATNADRLGNITANNYFKHRDAVFNSEWSGKYLWTLWDNHLHAADKRLAVTLTGTTSTNFSSLFDGSFESAVSITEAKAVLHIKSTTEGNVWTEGLPYGDFYVVFYNSDAENITGRVYCNYAPQGTGWHDLTITHVGPHIWKLNNGYYQLSDLEITITKPVSSASIDLCQVLHVVERSPSPYYAAVMSKYCDQKTNYNIEAAKFIKTGGTSSQFLKADGSVDSNTYSKSDHKHSFSDITPGVATIGDGANRLMFRTNSSYKNGIYYSTPGNEALVFGTITPITSWIFATVDPTLNTPWTSLTPSLQIKNGRVTINKLIANNTDASYNLDVNGSANATTLYENGVRVSVDGHTHTKSQITDFPTSFPASGGYANEIASKGMLDSQEKIDNFITPNRFEYALFKTTDANNVDFASNDGMIISIPWASDSYGFQMAFDDTHSGTVKVRSKSNSWGDWYTLLHSGNYTTYTVQKDGTGASGTWGISITGNAKTATTSTYASNVGSSGTAGTNYVTAANVISMYNWYNSITATDDASNTAIDKWNEIVSFLTGITDTSTLSGILAGYAAAGHNHDGRYLRYEGLWSSGSGQNVDDANGMAFVYRDHGSPNGWGILCTFEHTYNSGYKFQLFAEGYNADGMYYRCRSSDRGGWTSWKTVIDSGNIGSQHVSYADSAGNARNLLGRSTTGSDYGATDDNLVFAEWNTYSDNRWYLKAKGYETRVGYTNDSDKLDGYHETSFYRYRGDYGKSYTAASTEYNLGPGTYTTSEEGFSGTLLSFNSSGSASAIQFWTHYSQGNLYYRTSIDSNRWGKTDGSWTRILDSDSYTEYTVKKDGTGASGTWRINVTGSAGSVERATFGDRYNGTHDANAMTSNGLYYYYSNGPTTNAHNFEANDAAMYVQAYNSSWVSQIAQDYRSGKLAVRSRNDGTWQPWRRIAFADSDYIISADRMYYEPEHRKFTRTASGYSWDTQAYSVCGYKECRITYKISQTGAYIMVGLNSDPTTNANYQSIDYCWYTENGGSLSIYENGTNISSISGHTTYAVGDEFIVEYSCGQVRYYHNGVLCRTVARTYGSPLYFDSSFYNAGSIENVVFEPIHDSLDFVQTTASYSLSNASWTNTITLPTTAGSYILNIVSGNSTLTGVFSIGASDNAKDEISLHLHGNGPRLYARTNGTTLQLSSNDASATSRSVTIKYRRMI